MLTLDIANTIICFASLLVAYLISVTIAGFVRAWTALKMGDDTAASLGFLSLNPLVHLDPIGILVLFLFNFGWGRHVPVNPYKIHGSARPLRIGLTVLSDSITHLFIALCTLIIFVFTFGQELMCRVIPFLFQFGGLSILVRQFSDISSYAVVFGFIMVATVYLNVVLSVLSLIINGFSLFVAYHIDRIHQYGMAGQIGLFIVPFFVILFFSNSLKYYAIILLCNAAWYISKLFGL